MARLPSQHAGVGRPAARQRARRRHRCRRGGVDASARTIAGARRVSWPTRRARRGRAGIARRRNGAARDVVQELVEARVATQRLDRVSVDVGITAGVRIGARERSIVRDLIDGAQQLGVEGWRRDRPQAQASPAARAGAASRTGRRAGADCNHGAGTGCRAPGPRASDRRDRDFSR